MLVLRMLVLLLLMLLLMPVRFRTAPRSVRPVRVFTPFEFGLSAVAVSALASRVAPSSGPDVRAPPLVGPPGARG